VAATLPGPRPARPLAPPAMRTLALAAASLALLAARAQAQPIGIVDQRQYGTYAIRNDFAGTAAGQTFQPQLDRIDAAAFVFHTGSGGATLQLSLYGGVGIGGPLLGVSAPRVVTTSDYETVRFDLPAPVALVPTTDYTLFVRALTGAFMLEFTPPGSPIDYVYGDALDDQGVVAPGVDLVFAEGIEPTVTPEPATLALTGAGLLAVVALARVSARSAARGTARRPRS
jgi:hypothetical protein